MAKILITACIALSVSLALGVPVDNVPRAPTCQGNEHYFIAHESDCASYYVCYMGVLTQQHCSLDLLWDVRYDTCNFPHLVDCSGLVVPTVTARPTTQGPTSQPPAPTSQRPTTTTQRPVTTTQGETSQPPNPTTPQRPTTTQGPTSQPPRSTTTRRTPPPEGEFPCPADEFVYVAHPSDCTKFYLCKNGQFTSVYPCGVDLYFSTKLQACVRPEKSDCQQ